MEDKNEVKKEDKVEDKKEENMDAIMDDKNVKIRDYFLNKKDEILHLLNEYIDKNCIDFKKEKEKKNVRNEFETIWAYFDPMLPEIKVHKYMNEEGINFSHNSSTGTKSNVSFNLSQSSKFMDNNFSI